MKNKIPIKNKIITKILESKSTQGKSKVEIKGQVGEPFVWSAKVKKIVFDLIYFYFTQISINQLNDLS